MKFAIKSLSAHQKDFLGYSGRRNRLKQLQWQTVAKHKLLLFQLHTTINQINMTSQETLKQAGIYTEDVTIGGIPCSVGYSKQFKWAWLATQLNTFVIIGDTDEHIDRAMIERFSNDCFEYSLKNNKGWPRGLQSGVGSIAILKGNSYDQSAALFCEQLDKKHWSAFEIPVVYDKTSNRAAKYINRPIWGTIYFSYFTDLINSVLNSLKA